MMSEVYTSCCNGGPHRCSSTILSPPVAFDSILRIPFSKNGSLHHQYLRRTPTQDNYGSAPVRTTSLASIKEEDRSARLICAGVYPVSLTECAIDRFVEMADRLLEAVRGVLQGGRSGYELLRSALSAQEASISVLVLS